MNKPATPVPPVAVRKPLAEAAMQRAADRAREAAQRFGTSLHYIRDGQLVSEPVEPAAKP